MTYPSEDLRFWRATEETLPARTPVLIMGFSPRDTSETGFGFHETRETSE
jgi:hypothetical protein